MDTVLAWIAQKLRSGLIIWISLELLTWIAPIMSNTADTIREVIANPKTIGGAAGTGWVATVWESINNAAPDLLVYLSIFATCLTIWAFFSNRRRQKQRDKIEAAAREREEERKEELHRAQITKALEEADKERALRLESERKHALMEEISILSKKDADPVIIGEMMGKVTRFEPKRKEA